MSTVWIVPDNPFTFNNRPFVGPLPEPPITIGRPYRVMHWLVVKYLFSLGRSYGIYYNFHMKSAPLDYLITIWERVLDHIETMESHQVRIANAARRSAQVRCEPLAELTDWLNNPEHNEVLPMAQPAQSARDHLNTVPIQEHLRDDAQIMGTPSKNSFAHVDQQCSYKYCPTKPGTDLIVAKVEGSQNGRIVRVGFMPVCERCSIKTSALDVQKKILSVSPTCFHFLKGFAPASGHALDHIRSKLSIDRRDQKLESQMMEEDEILSSYWRKTMNPNWFNYTPSSVLIRAESLSTISAQFTFPLLR